MINKFKQFIIQFAATIDFLHFWWWFWTCSFLICMSTLVFSLYSVSCTWNTVMRFTWFRDWFQKAQLLIIIERARLCTEARFFGFFVFILRFLPNDSCLWPSFQYTTSTYLLSTQRPVKKIIKKLTAVHKHVHALTYTQTHIFTNTHNM